MSNNKPQYTFHFRLRFRDRDDMDLKVDVKAENQAQALNQLRQHIRLQRRGYASAIWKITEKAPSGAEVSLQLELNEAAITPEAIIGVTTPEGERVQIYRDDGANWRVYILDALADSFRNPNRGKPILKAIQEILDYHPAYAVQESPGSFVSGGNQPPEELGEAISRLNRPHNVVLK